MEIKDFLDAIAHVNSMWSMAAFAIAALLVVLRGVLASPDAVRKRGKAAPAILASGLIWPVAILICVLAALPILTHGRLESERIQQQSVYRVRVTVLDAQSIPVSGATIRTTATNETSRTEQGAGVVTIPVGTLSADRKVTIFADLDSAFLHGRTDLPLGDDLNPSVTIPLSSARDATVTGLVEDENGRAIPDVSINVLGGSSGETSKIGSFTLNTNAAVGQSVRLHAEKPGYEAVDQDHPAGNTPVTIVLPRKASGGRSK